MGLPKLPNAEILPESPGLTPSDSPHGGSSLGRLARAFFGGLLFAVALTLIGRGVLIFFIDPVPLTPSLILLEFGHVAGFLLIWYGLFRRRFFSDTTARRTVTVIFLLWFAAMCLKATSLAWRYDYLGMNSGFEARAYAPAWWAELLMSFPVSYLVMEDNIVGALMTEHFLLANPLLHRYVVNCLYWPLVLAIEGALWWTILFFALRALARLVKFLFRRSPGTKAPRPVWPASRRWSFFAVASALLFVVLFAWMVRLTVVHVERTTVWNRDFETARMIVARFFALNSRHPYTWDEIVEADFSQEEQNDRPLPPGTHFFKNPGFHDRSELNLDYLRKIDKNAENAVKEAMKNGTSSPSPFSRKEWIFRIRPVSADNPTGAGDKPFTWDGWNVALMNLMGQNLMFKIWPVDKEEPEEQQSAEGEGIQAPAPDAPSPVDPPSTDPPVEASPED